VIEDVCSSSNLGPVIAFTFGQGKGTLTAIVPALVFPCSGYTRQSGCGRCASLADKATSKALAARLFPDAKFTRASCPIE
jgi:hypothetical protein